MRMRAVLLSVAITGAMAVPAAAQLPQGSVDPRITDGRAQRALDGARAKWKAAHVSSYRMKVKQSCFCPPSPARTITVRRGRVVFAPASLKTVATVPRMFRLIQQAIDGRYSGVRVTYGKRGVPSSIALDRSDRIADEESYYTVSGFTRL